MTVMMSYRCKEFDDGTEVIESDMQVSCTTDRYTTITSSVGVVGLLLFVVAPGALFLRVLWPHRAILKKPPHRRTEEEKLIVAPTAFLHESYRPPAWWFESFEIIRRLAMCGAVNLWFPSTTTTGGLSLGRASHGKVGG